jgi:type II secretory pathway predicted ATPase ExeA
MFKQYFGLKFNPFSKECDVQNIFMSEDLKELSSRLTYIKKNRGIFLLIGEPGVGKTTALRRFYKELNPGMYKFMYSTLSTVTVMDFYRSILIELGEVPSHKKVTMFKQIQNSIQSLYYEQKIIPVIVLDEIQLVSSPILEDLRLLFSFKMDSQNPFVLILCGQTMIRNKLHLSMNIPLRQRISLKYTMKGISKTELPVYIEDRLKISGLTSENIFNNSSIEAIFSVSKGALRVVNNLCTSSLMYACSINKRLIDEEIVYQGKKDFDI